MRLSSQLIVNDFFEYRIRTMKEKIVTTDVEMSSSDPLREHGTPETQSSDENREETIAVSPTSREVKSSATMIHSQFVGWSALSRHEKYDLVGWIMFIFSAIFYLAASIEWKSVTSTIASLFFLLACFSFMIPMLWKQKRP